MNPLTDEQISDIITESQGRLSDVFCRYTLHWMMGYMRYSKDIEAAREAFFREIQRGLNQ